MQSGNYQKSEVWLYCISAVPARQNIVAAQIISQLKEIREHRLNPDLSDKTDAQLRAWLLWLQMRAEYFDIRWRYVEAAVYG